MVTQTEYNLIGEQKTAVDMMIDYIKGSSEPFFYMGGYAGTGKTYTTAALISRLLSEGYKDINVCAYTGKATAVLSNKLKEFAKQVNISTLHSALYAPLGNSAKQQQYKEMTEKYKSAPSDELRKEIHKLYEDLKSCEFVSKDNIALTSTSIVIIDEASMVDNNIKNDLLDVGASVIFIGDPGQLPPIKSDSWFHKAKPDIILNSVQRQALESPIIRLSMDIRNGSFTKAVAKTYNTEECRIIPMQELQDGDYYNHGQQGAQIICHTNIMRQLTNKKVRKLMQFDNSGIPMSGDKMICTKNQWINRTKFINGVQFNINEVGAYMPELNESAITAEINYEGKKDWCDLNIYECMKTYDDKAVWHPNDKDELLVDFGYCITVHKAQGSEWDRVMVYDEGLRGDSEERKRWLYTAVTRAKNKLLLASVRL